jgi:hypothetical protein
VMVQAYNSNYLGGGDWENNVSGSMQAKSSWDSPISTNGLMQLCASVTPSYKEKYKWKDHGPDQSGHKVRPNSKNNQREKGDAR